MNQKKMYDLYLGDCLEIMPNLPEQSVDMILCDLPYNITSMKWDCLIPFDKLWGEYNRIIKPNGNIVLFSSGLFSVDLINSNRKNFKYKLIWKKNVPTGMSSAKYRHMKQVLARLVITMTITVLTTIISTCLSKNIDTTPILFSPAMSWSLMLCLIVKVNFIQLKNQQTCVNG